ncbi:ABC transporter ATP-binding protein [Euzebya rosea]|uniref:ABC transporter ATP-binding protein n=1 Tax=Euzebya rosea TaxID=2052804 RepID=UPI001300A41F|nr:ABC transporter ATP-binding protein [Euzebya rosea]
MTDVEITSPSTTVGNVVVRATGLRKAFGEGDGRIVALDGADVEVRLGELLVVRGPSGCGKSTLLQCLSGILLPDDGTVSWVDVEGEVALADLDDDGRTELRAQRMGFVFQTLNLLPALTVRENVELPLVLGALPAGEIRQRASDALVSVGMGDRGEAFPAQLSGGQQQRVALARALVSEPDVIWADEPTGSLDSVAQAEMLQLMRAAVTPGRTVVVVSHAEVVAAAADRVITMVDGRVA